MINYKSKEIEIDVYFNCDLNVWVVYCNEEIEICTSRVIVCTPENEAKAIAFLQERKTEVEDGKIMRMVDGTDRSIFALVDRYQRKHIVNAIVEAEFCDILKDNKVNK